MSAIRQKGGPVATSKLRQRCSSNVASRIDVLDINVTHIEVVGDVNANTASDGFEADDNCVSYGKKDRAFDNRGNACYCLELRAINHVRESLAFIGKRRIILAITKNQSVLRNRLS